MAAAAKAKAKPPLPVVFVYDLVPSRGFLRSLLRCVASPPLAVPDSASPECMSCRTAFGDWCWRHHCRLCARLLCDKCSSLKAPLAAFPSGFTGLALSDGLAAGSVSGSSGYSPAAAYAQGSGSVSSSGSGGGGAEPFGSLAKQAGKDGGRSASGEKRLTFKKLTAATLAAAAKPTERVCGDCHAVLCPPPPSERSAHGKR